MAKITYEDKEALNVNPEVANKNKVNASDLNEIKNVINSNDDILNANAEIISQIQNVGEVKQYTLTTIRSAFNTGAWRTMAQNYTTDVIPAGKYLVVLSCDLSSGQSGMGLATVRPYIDGADVYFGRNSVPTGSALMAVTTTFIKEFNTDATHTLNAQAYPLYYNVTGGCANMTYYFIKLK